MHDRLRVYDDVDSVQVHAVQQMGLQQLKTLVHQCRGIGRDHPAHVPGRVREGLVRCGIAHLFVAESTEWSAASGEDQSMDLGRCAASEALGQG